MTHTEATLRTTARQRLESEMAELQQAHDAVYERIISRPLDEPLSQADVAKMVELGRQLERKREAYHLVGGVLS